MSETGAVVQMSDGVVYRGWVDEEGRADGFGTMTFPDGRVFLGVFVYTGEYEWQMRKSVCAVLLPDERGVRIGWWPSNLNCGFAAEVVPGGGIFAGGMLGSSEGNSPQAILTASDLLRECEAGNKSASYGVMVFPDDRVYVGSIYGGKAGGVPDHYSLREDGRPDKWADFSSMPFQFTDCDGVMRFPDGRVYVGEFTDGKPDGHGAMILETGFVRLGAFRDGEPVGE